MHISHFAGTLSTLNPPRIAITYSCIIDAGGHGVERVGRSYPMDAALSLIATHSLSLSAYEKSTIIKCL